MLEINTKNGLLFPRYKNCCFTGCSGFIRTRNCVYFHHRTHIGGGSVKTSWAVASPVSCSFSR